MPTKAFYDVVNKVYLLVLAVFVGLRPCPAADTNIPASRLTIDLRDGSRVVGVAAREKFSFRSPLLGELKLAVADLCAVEMTATNLAKVSTAGGDILTVTFAEPEIVLQTDFGQIKVPVSLLRKLTVSPANAKGAHPSGLVALWSGEDDGRDAVGGHDAELTDMSFADGKVGRAFALNGYSSWAAIPLEKSPQLADADGLTIAAWIKPADVNSFHPILEWEVTKQKNSVQLWLGHQPQDYGLLSGNIGDAQQNNHQINSPAGIILPGQFQHVALTYDKASGVSRLLVNGRVVAEQNIGPVTPLATGPIFISRRPSDVPGDWTYNKFFSGLLDEVSIYNRALSPEEIQSVCAADNHGDLPPAPRASLPARKLRGGF